MVLLNGVAALTAIVSLTATTAHASSLLRRVEKIPYIDYDGIALAATDAINHTIYRRDLGDSSAAYAHLAARNNNNHHPSIPTCKKITKRKEWRKLSYKEKKAYTRAIKCLQTKDDYGISPVSDKLYDAFVQVHQTNWTEFHGNANFLPWHRWFVWIHAAAMEYECGYTGPAPYWDYTLDYKNPSGSPIFSHDPEIGFGTHGSIPLNDIGLGGFKVDNGAFANLTVTLPEPHFLTRNFSFWKTADPKGDWGYELGESYSPEQVNLALQAPTFWDLEVAIDFVNLTVFNPATATFPVPGVPVPEGTLFGPKAGIHNAPHAFNMGDWNGPNWLIGTSYFPAGVVAPNDPMFWPHHGNVDRVFWKWQQKPGKQWEFNGMRSPNPADPPAQPTDILPFYGLGPDIPVALTLKTENWPMCYTY